VFIPGQPLRLILMLSFKAKKNVKNLDTRLETAYLNKTRRICPG